MGCTGGDEETGGWYRKSDTSDSRRLDWLMSRLLIGDIDKKEWLKKLMPITRSDIDEWMKRT